MSEGILGGLLSLGFHLGDDVVETGAFAEENVHAVVLVHLGIEAVDFLFHVDLHLGNPDGIHVPSQLMEEGLGEPVILVKALMVIVGGAGGEPAAVATHHFVNDQLACTGGVFVCHIAEKAGALVGRGPGTKSLFDGVDVVVDRLGQTDDSEVIAVFVKVSCEIGCGRVGVVSADGVKNIDLVRLQSFRRHFERVLAGFDETTLGAVIDIGELYPAIADRTAAEVVENGGIVPDLPGKVVRIAEEETLVSVQVTHQIGVRGKFVILFDQASNRGRKAGGNPAGGQKGNSHQLVRSFIKGVSLGVMIRWITWKSRQVESE